MGLKTHPRGPFSTNLELGVIVLELPVCDGLIGHRALLIASAEGDELSGTIWHERANDQVKCPKRHAP